MEGDQEDLVVQGDQEVQTDLEKENPLVRDPLVEEMDHEKNEWDLAAMTVEGQSREVWKKDLDLEGNEKQRPHQGRSESVSAAYWP